MEEAKGSKFLVLHVAAHGLFPSISPRQGTGDRAECPVFSWREAERQSQRDLALEQMLAVQEQAAPELCRQTSTPPEGEPCDR